MIVAVSLLVVSISILLYCHPPSTWVAPRNQVQEPPSPRTDASRVDKQSPYGDGSQQRSLDGPADQHPVSDVSPEKTPKALSSVAEKTDAIPTFVLAEHEDAPDNEDEEEEDNLPPPSFPALNSAQRASASPGPTLMGPPQPAPANSLSSQNPSSSLMPPPQIKPSSLRALSTANPAQGLRVPAAGGMPNRSPVPNRTPASVAPPNARGKVLLSPGHSPLDWANLQRSGTNLSGVPSLLRVTPSMLKFHNGRKGKPAWSSYQGKVYNITPYLPYHPGGEGELRRAAGKDGGKLFMEVHPWVNWENMLGECMVGILVSEEQEQNGAALQPSASLEDMD